MRRFLSLLVLAVFLGGCATVKGIGEDVRSLTSRTAVPAASQASSASVDCETQQQHGCWELRVLSFAWDPANPALNGLDRPYANQAERQDRVQFLGPRLWEEYRKGTVKAAAPKSYVIMMWKVNAVPAANLSAYRVNTRAHQVTKVGLEEVRDVKVPVFDHTATTLGDPQKIFRVRTSGADAVGASVQFPWTMVTPETYILICSEDQAGRVYPPGKNVGLWITPESLKWLKEKGSKRGLVPFVHQ